MNSQNSDYNDSFLNDVNITSNIRAPGEFKYFYCGDNYSETDKSFLVFSTMWHTERVTENMEIIHSCYNSQSTAQLFINKNTNLYNLFIYKNIIDYRNENLSLQLIKIINFQPKSKYDSQNNIKINIMAKNDKDYLNIMKSKIYFASNNFILLNENDCRILLIDINNASYITIFSKSFEEKEVLYNIFDTYNEIFLKEGQKKIRTYAFLSIKSQDRKTPTYKYSYFIIQKAINNSVHLYPINIDLGNSEPLCLKISRIVHKGKNGEIKSFFIFCFLSVAINLQLITDYDNLTLHQMLQKYFKINSAKDELIQSVGRENKEIQLKSAKYWIRKSNIKMEKIQLYQGMKIALNINSKKICSLIYHFETKGIICYKFNYFDTPEEISKKIFIVQRESNINNLFDYMKRYDSKISIYYFGDCYLFKEKCFMGISDKNLIIGENNIIHIYEENLNNPVFTYEFFQESLSSLIIIDGIACTFILTGKKLFKIIYNQRYKLFSNEMLFSKNKIHYYKYNYNMKKNNQTFENYGKPIYPLFEFKPEDIWNGYCNNLNIPPINYTNKFCYDIYYEKDEEKVEYQTKDEKYFLDNNLFIKKCVLCNKESELVCSLCGSRYYCCYDHMKYDYFCFHFFECQLIQFFKRKDIMTIPNLERRYKILYNELIKLSGRILNFIFRRIYNKFDYIYFLNMILTLINIFVNFGFHTNLSDFCLINFNTTNDKRKYKSERIIFYLEAIFYYVQLNFLKCTFALRGGLYNLTDCYIKIIKDDIIPKLIPKSTRRVLSLNFEKIPRNIIYGNDYFSHFKSPLFFDINKYTKYLGNNNYIDIIEEFIIKHLNSISLLTKFKIKIHSNIEVHNTFVDINLLFDDHYSETSIYKNIVPYCYFSTSFYLVEIGKISQTIKLLRRMVGSNFDLILNSKLRAFTYYNLGLLQYAIGHFDIGIHNIETSYKLIVANNFSEKIKFCVIDSLGLAYLNQKNLFKAYILIQTSVKERKKYNKDNYQIKCNRLNVYLNYIVDLYEYNFISKTRFLIEKKYKNYDKRRIIKFILGEGDKEVVISEQNLGQFIKVVEFIWKLSDNVLKQLNLDNPPKAPTTSREEIHHERNLSFNSDVSQMSSTFIYKENQNEKEERLEEYEEDIEVKTNLYDTLLTRQQQQEFKELKTIYLKRDIILRDSLGYIEKFNINFDPIYADEFQKIIENLKINFLLKEIFYCFQNEKWRDELYNYNQDNILFGLSKYLKLEKIQNMMAIERSKNIEIKNKEKIENKNNINNIYEHSSFEEEENSDNLGGKYFEDDWLNTRNFKENEESISNKNLINYYNFNKELSSMSVTSYLAKNKNMTYNKFKRQFILSLKELEKENKNDEELLTFMNLEEDYLYSLYKNVYQNNPDQNFIFQNPLLILNYIYLELKRPDSSNPIIGANNNIIHSVMTKVKEEDESFTFNSAIYSKKQLVSDKKNESLIAKRNRNSSSSSSSDSEEYQGKIGKKTSPGYFKKEEKENIITDQDNKRNNQKNYTKEFKQKLELEKKISEKDISLQGQKFINNNISDSFDSSEENGKNKNSSQKYSNEFRIVSKEAIFCFIPIRKITTFVSNIIKKDTKIEKKSRRKTQIIFHKNTQFYSFREYNNKNIINIAPTKKLDKTFIDEVNMLNFSKINEEEIQNKNNFEIFQRKNRQLTYKKINKESNSKKSSPKKIIKKNNSSKKNASLLKLTKKDILFGKFISTKNIGVNNKSLEKKKLEKNKTNQFKNSFNLEKELKEDKINKINKNNIYENKDKINNEKSAKDFTQYKNNSLIKNYIQSSSPLKKKVNSNNKKNSISNNYYSRFLNIKQKCKQKKTKENSLIKEKNNYTIKDYGFKSKKEREKEIEAKALEYLKFELNNKSTNINKNKLFNSCGVNTIINKKTLNKSNKISQKRKIIDKKLKENKEKEDIKIYSYAQKMKKELNEKENKNKKNGLITVRNKKNSIEEFDKKMKINNKENNKYIKNEKIAKLLNDNIDIYTSRLNCKMSKNEDSFNNKNLIFENSSYINYINNNSKFASLNISKIYKKQKNKSIEYSNDRSSNDNRNSESKRLIQKYKILPFLKINNSIRTKENSALMSLSNTNVHTPKSKRKYGERKNRSMIDIKKIKGRLIKNKQ